MTLSCYVATVDTCKSWRRLLLLTHPHMDEPAMRLLMILLREGRNVFLTGRGGTGKSTAMTRIRAVLEASNRRTRWMAPTGKAAIRVEDATTMHSTLKGALSQHVTMAQLGSRDAYLDKRNRRPRFFNDMEVWRETDTIVVDEVSMMSDDMWKRVALSAAMSTPGRKGCRIMGGRQVVFAGDLLQFPPVKGKFAFTTREWSRLNLHIVCLNYSWRHRRNRRYDRLLQRIRLGEPLISDLDLLQQMVRSCEVQERASVPHIFPTNAKKDAHNEFVEKHPDIVHQAEERIVMIERKRVTTRQESDEHDALTQIQEVETVLPMKDEWQTRVEKAKAELEPRAPKLLALTVGNTYSLVRNMDVSAGLGNGTSMIYDGDGNRFSYRRFDKVHKYRVQRHRWRAKLEDAGRDATIYFERYQYMVIPSAGMTIHRAQGSEFDRVHIDFGRGFGGDPTRETAIIYTGLSRGKRLAGTSLESMPDPKRIRAHPLAVEFYKHHGLA